MLIVLYQSIKHHFIGLKLSIVQVIESFKGFQISWTYVNYNICIVYCFVMEIHLEVKLKVGIY